MSKTAANSPGWKDATVEYLSRLPVKDWPTQLEIVRRLSISEVYFRQKLSLEGTSYRNIKNEVRLNRAIDILRSGCYRSIAEVADAMEFCDEHSFRRMFKRWAGCSPALYLIRRSPL